MGDCNTCPEANICTMMQADVWLQEHDNEIDELGEKTKEFFKETLTRAINEFPLMIVAADLLTILLAQGVRIGYYCGRTYQDVPEVLRRL
jgi:hypothetical protein